MQQEQASSIGSQLRRYRERAGLTQEALAEKTGLTAAAISALERGLRRHPYPHTVHVLALALGLSPEERAALASARPRPGAMPAATSAVLPTPARTPLPPANLPAPRTALIGREREVADLCDLVCGSEARLVTLTGVGGGGKTRLALAVAGGGVPAAFPDGVYWLDLAPMSDPALLPQTVAATLSVPERPAASLLDTLVAWLQPRALLLVLDNCEHLIDACAHLAERLLDACPAVHLLATSRQPLQIAGERPWRVHPLAVPDPDQPAIPDALARYDAVRLFVARAQAVAPDFRLTEANAGAVAQVCIRLDGIPLALELAAARVRVLPVAQILERLDDTLRLLTDGSRAAPTRQQTLRAALDWSHELLTEPERAVFRRLAVFAGGCTLEAAEAVCGNRQQATGNRQQGEDDASVACCLLPVASVDVLDLLSRLVDKSLVLVEETGEVARFRLLEPVRQYAQQRLTACGEEEATRARHAACYLALAERANPELRGPQQVAWLARLEREHDNLRAALRWALQRGDTRTGLRLAVALLSFWEGHYPSEGRRWLHALLAAPGADTAPGPLRTWAIHGAGVMAWYQGDLDAGESLCAEAAALARTQRDEWSTAVILACLGEVVARKGDLARAIPILEESLRRSLTVRDQSLAQWPRALALFILGSTVIYQGDVARACAGLEEALALFRELGDVRFVAQVCTTLGHAVLLHFGDAARAAALVAEGLTGSRAVGDSTFLVFSLLAAARVLVALGRPARAARLLGAAEVLCESMGAPFPPMRHPLLMAIVAAVRTHLHETEFDAVWAAGRGLTAEEAVREALAAMQLPTSPAPARTPLPAAPLHEPLTRREREVAQLLAQGYTDRQIAAALTLAVGTVGVHVHHILAKLGLHSRWQVAEWAGTHDLPATRPD